MTLIQTECGPDKTLGDLLIRQPHICYLKTSEHSIVLCVFVLGLGDTAILV